ncbi:MAG: chondroitinase family polysaccharide lyase [Candidatus Cryptobacteroides sp.]
MKRKIIFLLAAFVLSLGAEAQVLDYGREHNVLSFESGVDNFKASKGSELAVSDWHNKLGNKALEWNWKRRGASISISENIPYLKENPNPKETSVSSFVFWVYAPKQLGGQLEFNFYKGDRLCCHFSYNMDFTGWRGSWVAFDRDMQGTPEEGMDRLVITAPKDVKEGQLFFDGIMLSSFEDVRHHTPDFQAPFVNEATTSHWLILNNTWKLTLDVPEKTALTAADIEDMNTVKERFVSLVTAKHKAKGLKWVRRIYDSYNISFNPDGTIKGKPIFFTRYGETFINEGIADAQKQLGKNGQLLRQFNDNMLGIACEYMHAATAAEKREIAKLYVNLTKLILDQGFEAGSGLGTLHHLGYSMRNFYTAPVIMHDVLREAGLSGKVQQAMEWFSGVGEVKLAPKEPGIDIDAFNTSLMGRVASVLMLDDGTYKYAYMQALSRWIDNGFKYADGLRPCFKTDGTVMHHRKAYPAYARDGFGGAVNAVWMLARTGFAISQPSHENLKRALLEMRFYSNVKSFPLAMSGRHPDGEQRLNPSQFSLLADAGTPDGSKAIDPELAAAYLRLNGDDCELSHKFITAGITAEKAPQGTHAYAFNCSMSHRTGEALVTIAGHSRYLWAAETYNGANHYGRYLTHGSMQILGSGEPQIDSRGSGYRQEGWDWCHIPGTTAAVRPMEEMKADVLNVDIYSGYEEMLLSDEWFAGGVTHKGVSGAYAMKLHEHDKYNGSLRAHKSFFAFENRVICLGSDIENTLEGTPVHTTLFQNEINKDKHTCYPDCCATLIPCIGKYKDCSGYIGDCLGNYYIVKDADICIRRSRQHSLHEETDAPTEGDFELAWIDNDSKRNYEYMVVVKPDFEELSEYVTVLPYEVLSCDSRLHAVKDLPSGTVACAVFEEGPVDSLIYNATESMLMYTLDNKEGQLALSVANPDLAIYSGESDEIFDAEGKRVERSIYGRKWVDEPCQPTTVRLVVKGLWQMPQFERVGSDGDSFERTLLPTGGVLDVRRECGNTVIKVTTKDARTEEFVLDRVWL